MRPWCPVPASPAGGPRVVSADAPAAGRLPSDGRRALAAGALPAEIAQPRPSCGLPAPAAAPGACLQVAVSEALTLSLGLVWMAVTCSRTLFSCISRCFSIEIVCPKFPRQIEVSILCGSLAGQPRAGPRVPRAARWPPRHRVGRHSVRNAHSRRLHGAPLQTSTSRAQKRPRPQRKTMGDPGFRPAVCQDSVQGQVEAQNPITGPGCPFRSPFLPLWEVKSGFSPHVRH